MLPLARCTGLRYSTFLAPATGGAGSWAGPCEGMTASTSAAPAVKRARLAAAGIGRHQAAKPQPQAHRMLPDEPGQKPRKKSLEVQGVHLGPSHQDLAASAGEAPENPVRTCIRIHLALVRRQGA